MGKLKQKKIIKVGYSSSIHTHLLPPFGLVSEVYVTKFESCDRLSFCGLDGEDFLFYRIWDWEFYIKSYSEVIAFWFIITFLNMILFEPHTNAAKEGGPGNIILQMNNKSQIA